MPRLSQETKDKILDDFHLGKSQNSLSYKYKCSPATINKICKGVVPKFKDKVNTVVSIKTDLSRESEYLNESFDKEVNEMVRKRNLVFNATEKLIVRTAEILDSNKTIEKVNVGDGVQSFEPRELNTTDLKNLSDTIDKASVTLNVNPRHSTQQINVNTQNNQVQVKEFSDFYDDQ